jgi:hypothetical protein
MPTPHSTRPILPMTQSRIDLFWSGVAVRGEAQCWLWIRGIDTNGYGIFQVHEAGIDARPRRSRRCHRIAYALYHKREPTGFVCHSCDNPTCCNPNHLFEGTPTDNVWDRERKGRGNNPHQRLTKEQVVEIRKLYPPPTDKLRPRGKSKHTDGTPRYADVAQQYGVDTTSIERIANNKSWRHIQ